MALTVTVEQPGRADQLLAAAGPLTPGESKAVAAEIARLVQRHLRMRDDTHAHTYPEGGKRSHFWRKAAQAVSFDGSPDEISVTIAHEGARLRYAGAPYGIRPVNAKALAIPASGMAYGRSPREFFGLRLVVFKGKGKAALVLPPRKDEGEALGRIMFWLVKKTKPIRPDPTVLPPPQVVLGLAVNRIRQLRKVSDNGQ
jgi:hypothetical protein